MKKTVLFALIVTLTVLAVSAQSPAVKYNPVGKWQFEAPYAPPEYSIGTIEVGLNAEKYTATMVFSGIDFKLPGEQVEFENNTLKFLIFVEGMDVNIALNLESESKMSGKAIHSEGEIPITLTRVPEKK
jgi:hypothetical protein